jgi:RNA polymerase primary sigma factor
MLLKKVVFYLFQRKEELMLSAKRSHSEDQHLFQCYLNDIGKYPLMTKKEENAIRKEIRNGSRTAFHRLVCLNLRFVIKVALIYRGQGLPFTDLINEGNLGLIEAAKRYDPDRKVKFTTYAVWWIRHAINRAIFKKARMVRLSVSNELQIRRIGKHPARFRQIIGGGQRVDTKRLAASMGFTSRHMEDLLTMNQQVISLDAPAYRDSQESWSDKLVDRTFWETDRDAVRNSLHRFIADSMTHLNPKERKILSFSFGLNSNEPMNPKKLAELMGLSSDRIRKIRKEALNKMKHLKSLRDYLLAA